MDSPTSAAPPLTNAETDPLSSAERSAALLSNKDDHDDSDDDSSSSEYNLQDDEDDYPHLFQSIRSPTGLEIGVRVTWPGIDGDAIELSTCLPSEEIAPMFHGTQWAGTRVWKAAIVALQYLLEEKGPLKERLAAEAATGESSSSLSSSPTFSCLELGCGLGVPGMLLHRFFPSSHIVLTDCEALLPQLQQNLAQNIVANSTTNNSGSLTAATLDWENEAELDQLLKDNQLDSFDVVINCDCIYEPLYGESWKALLKVQVALLQRQPNTLMLTSLERRKFDGADRYLAMTDEQPCVDRVVLVHEDSPVQIYRIFGKDQ